MERDGQHDFDFEIGSWKTHLRRRLRPLTGSNFSNSGSGTLAQPTIGEFKDGRGEFYDQEMFNGRAILVRFVISDIKPNSVHFEQSYSDDGGKSWEVNWIADDTRVVDPDR